MKEEMERLVSLQRIDSEIARYDHEIARREEDLTKRGQAIQENRDKLEALRARSEKLAEKQRDNQSEHDEAQARMKEAQGKMMLVQTSREHQALLKGIEDSRKVVKESEERALQFIEQLEQLEVEMGKLESLCESDEAKLEEAGQNAAKEIKKLAAEKKKIEGERAEKAAAVDAGFMRRYDKLIAKRGGLAVAALVNGVCQGCHMTLPPQQVNEVLKGDKLNCCPTCQRILFFQEPEEGDESPAHAGAYEPIEPDDQDEGPENDAPLAEDE